MGLCVLVCGGRDYWDREYVYMKLDEFHARTPITRIIHGNAPGADSLADAWATARGVDRIIYPASWKRGKVAGFERNARMLSHGKPDIVFAFPGGSGTANMCGLALEAGVEVRHFHFDRQVER